MKSDRDVAIDEAEWLIRRVVESALTWAYEAVDRQDKRASAEHFWKCASTKMDLADVADVLTHLHSEVFVRVFNTAHAHYTYAVEAHPETVEVDPLATPEP